MAYVMFIGSSGVASDQAGRCKNYTMWGGLWNPPVPRTLGLEVGLWHRFRDFADLVDKTNLGFHPRLLLSRCGVPSSSA
jgi:hypothetical protein